MQVLILAILAAAIAFAGFAPAYAQVSLRSSVSVSSADVRVNDIFAGSGNDTVIAETPAPGRRLVLDVYALQRIARRHNIDWNSRTRFDQSVVTRKSRRLDLNEIELAVMNAFKPGDLDSDTKIELTNRAANIRVADNLAAPYRVENAFIDPRSGRVTATLAVSGGKSGDLKYRLDGMSYSIVEIPTVSRRIRRGETIDESDVVWKKFRKDLVGRNMVRDRSTVVGKASRRFLAPGKPLLIDDLEAPKLVRKGALVTIYLETANLRLTAKARASEDGALNDTIQVVNVRSKKVVEAIVRSPTKVVIPTELPATN